jgi:hypothetical protein
LSPAMAGSYSAGTEFTRCVLTEERKPNITECR